MSTIAYLLRKYWSSVKGSRGRAILIAALYVCAWTCMTLEPFMFGRIISKVQHSPAEALLASVTPIISTWLALRLLFDLFFRFAEFLASGLGYRAYINFIKARYSKLARLSLKWHAEHHSGESISRVNKGSYAINDMIAQQWEYSNLVALFAGSLAALFFFSPAVAWLAVAIAALDLFLCSFVNRRLAGLFDRINLVQNKALAVMFDFISNMRTIIILRLEKKTVDDVSRSVEAGYRPTVMAYGVFGQAKWLINSLSITALKVGLVFYYIKDNSGSPIDAGIIASLFIYLDRFADSFFTSMYIYEKLMKYKADLKNADSIEEAADLLPPENRRFAWKKIELRGVKFSYGGRHAAVLSGIDLAFRRGEKIALMGESGAGKSTLMLLLRGLAQGGGGEVIIDGRAAARGFGALAPITTLMLQDPEVFEQTIRYNITMGLDYSDAEIEKAIRLSRFDQVLLKLPAGLDTDIREKGVNLSGGERQRLVLARNILAAKSSDIILMDESTSSVDAMNEGFIYDGLLREFKDKTIIASVHKPAVAEKFRRVIRIENGAAKTSK